MFKSPLKIAAPRNRQASPRTSTRLNFEDQTAEELFQVSSNWTLFFCVSARKLVPRVAGELTSTAKRKLASCDRLALEDPGIRGAESLQPDAGNARCRGDGRERERKPDPRKFRCKFDRVFRSHVLGAYLQPMQHYGSSPQRGDRLNWMILRAPRAFH